MVLTCSACPSLLSCCLILCLFSKYDFEGEYSGFYSGKVRSWPLAQLKTSQALIRSHLNLSAMGSTIIVFKLIELRQQIN